MRSPRVPAAGADGGRERGLADPGSVDHDQPATTTASRVEDFLSQLQLGIQRRSAMRLAGALWAPGPRTVAGAGRPRVAGVQVHIPARRSAPGGPARRRRARRPVGRSDRAPEPAGRTGTPAADWPRRGSAQLTMSRRCSRRRAANPGLHGQQWDSRRAGDCLRREAAHPRTRCPAKRLGAGQQLVRGRWVLLARSIPSSVSLRNSDHVDAVRTRRPQVDKVTRWPAEENRRGSHSLRSISAAGWPRSTESTRSTLGWITGPQLVDQLAVGC